MNPAHDAHSYYQRFDRVAAYIEAHLDQHMDLNILAEVAHFSPYHFHRIYHALSGETVVQMVKRLRLHRAAGYLVQTHLSIAEIAKCTGYPNVQSFTRIFKSEFGSPPAFYRKTGSHTRFLPHPDPAPLLSPLPSLEVNIENKIEVNVIDVQPMFGICAEHRGSYLNIKRAFDLLFRWATARGLVDQVLSVVGIYQDDPFAIPEKQLHARACLMFEQEIPLEPPFARIEILNGPCAVLRHQGPYADMRLAYQWLYGEWLPRSSREVADQPVFEVYLNHPRDTAPPDLLVDIYLPLQVI